MKRLVFMTVVAVMLCTSVAMAANDVTVESKTVAPGESGATVGVLITNDVDVRTVTIPLVLREVCGGSFVDSLAISFGDRLPPGGPLGDFRVRNQYASEDGSCKANQLGGFGTLTYSENSLDGVMHDVTASPWGALGSALRFFGATLTPGTDASGSIFLTMNVNGLEGQFEIDSTCTDPANHVSFVQNISPPVGVTPTFTKGVITVGTGCGQENQPPVAACADTTLQADGNCEATVTAGTVDAGSFDPDGNLMSLTLNPPAGQYGVGAHQFWLVVEDSLGAKDSCQATVTIEDVTPPVAVCPGDIAIGNDLDSCGATVQFAVSATDNCSGASAIATPASGTFFSLGTTTVEVVATDAAGNVDTCYFDVTVNDTQAPSIACSPMGWTASDPGACGATVLWPDDLATATDNCGPSTVTFVPPSGTIFPVGTTPVLAIATDAAGNADTCGFDVEVRDVEPPVAECHADTGVLVGSQDTSAVVTFSSGVTDNCDSATIDCTPASGSTFPLGGTLVTCIATDAAGNADTCAFTVTVTSEQLPPEALCQDIQLVADSNCQADGSVDNGSNDPDGGNVTFFQDPPGPYGLGQTPVTLFVTDDEGDTASCQATVTVVDETLPTIACTMENAGSVVDVNCEYEMQDYANPGRGAYTASDNCGSPTITQTPAVGTMLGLGPHTVWLIAEDGSGNKDSCSWVLTLRDQTPPVIECPVFVVPWEVGTDSGQCGAVVEWSADLATTTDNCGSFVRYVPASGSFFEVGLHVITAIAEDETGNADTCYIDLTVVDSEAPVAQCPGNIEKTVQSPVDTATITWTATVTDNCPGATIACTPPSGTVFGLGVTDVMCIATDAAGNADTCSFTVTVNQVSGCEGAMLTAMPDTLCFYATECDSVPQCDTIYVDTDTPGCNLPWRALASEPWIVSITPGDGTTPGGAVVCVDPSGLTPGYYTDSVEIYQVATNTKGIVPDAYVRVRLTVNEVIPVLGLSDAFFSFNATECGPQPATQSFDVLNANPDACAGLDWVATEDAPWMSLNPTSGTSLSTVDITVDQTGLSPGPYVDTITVTSAGAVGSPAYVVVEFTVEGCIDPVAGYTVGDVCGAVGDTVPVEVNFCNNFPASGMSLGLTYETSFVRIVSADFTGSRVEYLDSNLVATLDDVAGTICLAALVFPSDPLIDTGCGLFATLYFEIVDCVEDIVIAIDSTTIGQGCMALFTDANLKPVQPSFGAGSVCIECSCILCGQVIDAGLNPLGPALVELWDSYPDGSILETITTDEFGDFCFEALESGVLYDLRIVVPGYCPLIVADFGCTYDEIPLFEMSPLPEIPTQPRAADWWSTNATIQGVPIMPGDVITAMDPDGVICGVDVVENPGEFLVLVVADDPLTPGDEGAEAGDVITLYLNCECPLVAQGFWEAFGNTEFDPNFDCARKPIEIPLCDTWTLISFNVLPTDPSVDSVLVSIDTLYQHLLSATCADGNISWEKDRPINDLNTMDPWHGYWVKPVAPGVGPIIIDGAPLDADLPLALCTGWNAMSYLPTVPDELPHALNSIDGQYEHVFTAECEGIRSWDRNRPAILNDLVCMKPGYGYWIKMDSAATQTYPVTGYNCSPAGLAKPVNILDRVTVTPRYADFWSANQTGLYAGDRITIRTTSGVICGEALAGSEGMFMVHVYGDDPTTEAVEGATEGTELVFEVNGEIASLASGSPIWNERGSREVTVRSAGSSPLPTEFALLQNYPNPFNPSTTLAFRMPEASDVRLTVYNVLGQPVRTVFAGYLEAGTHTVEWDGRTSSGETVQSGIYFYRLQTANWSDAKKMTLLK